MFSYGLKLLMFKKWCTFTCARFMYFTGSSGRQFSGLSAGGHTLKIVADNCGTNRRPLVVEFTVEGVSIG